MQAVPAAVAGVRGADGFSPPEASDLLVDVLKHSDGRGPRPCNNGLHTALVAALGRLRPKPGKVRCPNKSRRSSLGNHIQFFGCDSTLYYSSLHGTAQFETPDLSKLHAEDQENMRLECAPYVFSYTG